MFEPLASCAYSVLMLFFAAGVAGDTAGVSGTGVAGFAAFHSACVLLLVAQHNACNVFIPVAPIFVVATLACGYAIGPSEGVLSFALC